eukprot:728450-Prymnesium_polylepis.1
MLRRHVAELAKAPALRQYPRRTATPHAARRPARARPRDVAATARHNIVEGCASAQRLSLIHISEPTRRS